MADEIASLYATIGADISSLSKGLANASKQIGDFGKDLTTHLTLPIVAFGAAALKSFSDSETQIAQLNAVLKSTKGVAGVTSKAAIDLSKALQKVTRYSDEDVLSAENLLLTFTKVGKQSFPDATKAVLDMSTAMGQDLKTSAIQIGKALNDPLQGITALTRVGVTFSQQQKEQIKNMVAVGNIAGAQKVILAELNREFGGSAVAAGSTFAGAMDKLKNKFDDFLEVVGEKMAPTLSKGIDFLSGLIDKLGALPPGVIELGLGAAAAIAALGPLLTIVGNLTAAFGLLEAAMFPVLIPMALIGGLIVMYTNNTLGFRDAVNKLGDVIRGAVVTAGQLAFIIGVGVNGALTRLGQILDGPVKSAVTWIKQQFDLILAGAQQAMNAINNVASHMPKAGGTAGPTGNTFIGGPVGGILGIGNLLKGALGFAEGGYTGSGNGIAGLVHGGEYVVPKGGALVSGGGGPQTIHLIADFGDAVQHIYFNVGEAINRGNAMPLRRMS